MPDSFMSLRRGPIPVAITVSTLVCALVARAAMLGATQLPEGDEQRDRARTEGWIMLPTTPPAGCCAQHRALPDPRTSCAHRPHVPIGYSTPQTTVCGRPRRGSPETLTGAQGATRPLWLIAG